MKKNFIKTLVFIFATAQFSEIITYAQNNQSISNISVNKNYKRDTIKVSSKEEFLSALKHGYKNIIVTRQISVWGEAENDMNLKPVEIPSDVTIDGQGNGRIIFRSPIQLTGDNVTFKNIDLNFISSTSMGSNPHREIFLAGHSLTFDNVTCYTKGAGGSLGGFGSEEDELLPEIYAGGYKRTNVGNNAQFNVINANSKTMIKAIYAGHGEGNYNMVPYKGKTTISLDPKTIIRDGIFSNENKENVLIKFNGSGSTTISSDLIIGNEKTKLIFDGVNAQKIKVSNVGNIVLKNNSVFEPIPYSNNNFIQNIKVNPGTILNLNSMTGTTIKGNFNGGGKLILDSKDSLFINGNITGKTEFQTWGGNILLNGELENNKAYVSSSKTSTDDSFVLSPSYTNHKMIKSNNNWIVQNTIVNDNNNNFKNIEVYGPDDVYLEDLKEFDNYKYIIKVLDEDDSEYEQEVYGAIISANDISNTAKLDWSVGVYLDPTEDYGTPDYDGSYYLYSFPDENDNYKATEGEYIMILMLEEIGPDDTIGDLLSKEVTRKNIRFNS